MLTALLLLLFSGVINTNISPVFADVFVGNAGPYRFLVDSGSQTSLIDDALARQLKLNATYRVEIVTQNSTRLLPAAKSATFEFASSTCGSLSWRFTTSPKRNARLNFDIAGVLGMNALVGFDLLLQPNRGKLEPAASRPAGDAVPFRTVDGRIAIKARMGNEDLTFLLDSGATHVVLFRIPQAMAASQPIASTINTLDGARRSVPTCWTSRMSLTDSISFKLSQRPLFCGQICLRMDCCHFPCSKRSSSTMLAANSFWFGDRHLRSPSSVSSLRSATTPSCSGKPRIRFTQNVE